MRILEAMETEGRTIISLLWMGINQLFCRAEANLAFKRKKKDNDQGCAIGIFSADITDNYFS